MNINVLSLGRLAGRNDVRFQTGNQTNFFLKKIGTSGVCVAVKTICRYYTLVNIRPR